MNEQVQGPKSKVQNLCRMHSSEWGVGPLAHAESRGKGEPPLCIKPQRGERVLMNS